MIFIQKKLAFLIKNLKNKKEIVFVEKIMILKIIGKKNKVFLTEQVI